MTMPKLIKLPKAADTKLITALAELGSALEEPSVTGYICLVTHKAEDSTGEDIRYYTSSNNMHKDLYLTKVLEKFIMGDL